MASRPTRGASSHSRSCSSFQLKYQQLEVRIIIRGFRLDASDQERVHKLIHRLGGGGIAVYHPESPVTPYSASAELVEPAIGLMREWLRHPQGCSAACVVSGSAPLEQLALAKLASNVFGLVPAKVILNRSEAEALGQAPIPFHHALRPTQGWPSFAPALRTLPGLSLKRHYAAPLARICRARDSPVRRGR